MFCAISGEIPEEPVVSRKSGHLFEKRVIEKALTASGGKCPETGEELQAEDLIEVKVSGKATKPMQSTATSFPGLLNNLQSEWDSIMLENHQVKKLLNKTRQELAHALYQYDAASRLIAKLITEKDELQAALKQSLDAKSSNVSKGQPSKRKLSETVESEAHEDVTMGESNKQTTKSSGDDTSITRDKKRLKETAPNSEKPVDDLPVNGSEANELAQLSAGLIESVETLSMSLRMKRKSRQPSPSLEKSSAIETFTSVAHCSELGELPSSSITFLDEDRIATGSLNGKLSILNATSLKIEHTHDTGTSSICALASHIDTQPFFVSGSNDGCVRLWDSSNKEEKPKFIQRDSSGIVDLACHPNGKLLFSCTDDGNWTWHDVDCGKVLSRYSGSKNVKPGKQYRSGAIHPDGVLFATGCLNGTIEMWDIRSMKNKAEYETPNIKGDFGVSSLNMSENGYYLLAGINGTVVIWDLRKHKIAREFQIDERPGPLNVQLDYSALYGCALSKDKLVLFSAKKRGGILNDCSSGLNDMNVAVPWRRPGVAWARDTKAVIVGHADGTVHRYAKAELPQ